MGRLTIGPMVRKGDDMFEPGFLVLIAGVFFLAGSVKGVVGLGLPTVSLGLLSMVVDLPTAMALLLVPSFVTNVWQALVGGQLIVLMRRLWPFLVPAALAIGLGGWGLRRLDGDGLKTLLGALICLYALIGLSGLRLSLTQRQERFGGPVVGLVNGILTGLTGSFVVPGVMFLQSLGLHRDALVQAMGLLFTLSTLALALSLHAQTLIGRDAALLSGLSLPPALVGMYIGQRLRAGLSDQTFRRIFFIALLGLGFLIVLRSVLLF